MLRLFVRSVIWKESINLCFSYMDSFQKIFFPPGDETFSEAYTGELGEANFLFLHGAGSSINIECNI